MGKLTVFKDDIRPNNIELLLNVEGPNLDLDDIKLCKEKFISLMLCRKSEKGCMYDENLYIMFTKETIEDLITELEILSYKL